jgi:septal ring-binding cell division protein DamX
MSQLTIKLSDKADALIAQLQKQIFNRRRKKVSPAGVVETLVESGAKSQSDKRFATSWKNLIADIESAAKVADAHGVKPANLSDEEWAMVLNHRSRPARQAATKAVAKKPTAKKAAAKRPAAKKAVAKKAVAKKAVALKPVAPKPVSKKAPAARKPAAKKAAPARPASRNPVKKTTPRGTALAAVSSNGLSPVS